MPGDRTRRLVSIVQAGTGHRLEVVVAGNGSTRERRKVAEAVASRLNAADALLAAAERAHGFLGTPSRHYRAKYPDRGTHGAEDRHVAGLLAAAIETAKS